MYMNASEHIAYRKAPRAKGIGELPSQHTGSQPGAVKRRASHTFAEYRSASTGAGLECSRSERVRCPEPPHTSIARRVPRSTAPATDLTTASATTNVGSPKRYRK